jgi:NADP-dependent 3-hydroxy acid dehydrogenase YdfG
MTRVALVTGCTSGIGAATAGRLADRGWTVAATGRRPEALDELAARPGVHTYPLDVADHESIATAHKQVVDDLGPVDALVNNAGYGLLGAVEEVDLDAVRRQFETNVFGLLDLTQLVLPSMRARRTGVVVNVSSVAGFYADPFGGVYAATKHAVEALSDALRLEVAPWGVKVVLIEPGPVDTAFGERAKAESASPARAASPYAPWLDALEAQAEGIVARVQKSAEHCAAVIVKAIESRHPKARYRVTMPAHVMPAALRVLPTRAVDGLTKRMFGLHKSALVEEGA